MASAANNRPRHSLLTISKVLLAITLFLATIGCFEQSPTPTRRATPTPAVTSTEYPTPTYPTPAPLPTDPPTPAATFIPTAVPKSAPPGSLENYVTFIHECIRDNTHYSQFLKTTMTAEGESPATATALVAAIAHSREFTNYLIANASEEDPALHNAFSAMGATDTGPCPPTDPIPQHEDIRSTTLYTALLCRVRTLATVELQDTFRTSHPKPVATLLTIYLHTEVTTSDLKEFLDILPEECKNQIKHGPFTFPLRET